MSNEQPALIPIEEHEVEFYGDTIMAVKVEENHEQRVYVPLRPIVTALGLAWGSQTERLRRDEVLRDEVRFVLITRTNSAGGNPRVLALPLDMIAGYLFGIDANRVRPDLKERVLLYRRLCFRVLDQALRGNIAPRATDLTELSNTLTQFIDRASETFVDHDERLTVLEDTVTPGSLISKKQIGIVKNKVQALASEMARRSADKDAPRAYGRIYAALYRTFGAASIDDIRQSDYADVLALLDRWREDAGLDRQLGLGFDT